MTVSSDDLIIPSDELTVSSDDLITSSDELSFHEVIRDWNERAHDWIGVRNHLDEAHILRVGQDERVDDVVELSWIVGELT